MWSAQALNIKLERTKISLEISDEKAFQFSHRQKVSSFHPVQSRCWQSNASVYFKWLYLKGKIHQRYDEYLVIKVKDIIKVEIIENKINCWGKIEKSWSSKMKTQIPMKLILIGLLSLIDFSQSRAVSWISIQSATCRRVNTSKARGIASGGVRETAKKNLIKTRKIIKNSLWFVNNLSTSNEEGFSKKERKKWQKLYNLLRSFLLYYLFIRVFLLAQNT